MERDVDERAQPRKIAVVHRYFVYLMASRSGVLYVGVTNDLERRVWEHKHPSGPSYTQKYHVNRLVFFEETSRIDDAIGREKQIKGWLRAKKLGLIKAENPTMRDLSDGWYT